MDVYLDHAATTPPDPQVLAAMAEVHASGPGNPSSGHRAGRRARHLLEDARARLADALGARAEEMVFVRGGTEGDNLAVLGRALQARQEGRGPPVVAVSAIEHPAVLSAAEAVRSFGGSPLHLRMRPDGRVEPEDLERALSAGPAVVSVMWVNNETGLQPALAPVLAQAREAGVPVHTDAVQAVGKVPVRLDRDPVHLLTLTGHKLGGPTGAGALFVRSGTALVPLLHGGGQERALRPGTEDVAGAVGLATAVERAVREQPGRATSWAALGARLEAGLRARVPGLVVHGAEGPRAPHILNVGLPGVDGDALRAGLDLAGVAVSGGSACASGSGKGSHVLEALYGRGLDRAALRFSFGAATTPSDIDDALRALSAVLDRLEVPA